MKAAGDTLKFEIISLKMEILYFSLFFFTFILLFKFVLFFSNKIKNLPPSIFSLPIIGHFFLLKKPLHKSLAILSNKYGPLLYLKFGSRPVLIVSSPKYVEECFTKNNDAIFANRPRLSMGRILGDDYTSMLWAPYGPLWRNLRRISATHILSPNSVCKFADIRMNEVKCMIKRLSGSQSMYQTVEMRPVFFELALNNMMRMTAGKTYYSENREELVLLNRFKEIVRATISLGDSPYLGDFMPIMRWFGNKGFEKNIFALKENRDTFLQTLIEDCRRLRSSVTGEDKKNTLINILLSIQESDPNHHTDKMILGLIWILFAAGTEPLAFTMEWAMSLLLNNPRVLKKAQKEIEDNISKTQLIDNSDIKKLPYLQAIIKETLRIYPPGPLLLAHESSEDCIVGGYNVPRGTMLLVNAWAIQNDPKLWEDPSVFRPERFEGLEGLQPTFKYLPFGLGRRSCPGEGIAMQTIGLALGALLQCFHWERDGTEMIDMTTVIGITMAKQQPLNVKCISRSITTSPIFSV